LIAIAQLSPGRIPCLKSSCFSGGAAATAPGVPFERLTTPADRLPGTSFDLIPESPKADGTSASTRGIFWRERSASPLSSAAQAEVLLSAGMMIATNGDLVGGQSNQSCTAMVYDAVGNILSKTGVGTYEYPGSAGGRTFRDGPRRIVTPRARRCRWPTTPPVA